MYIHPWQSSTDPLFLAGNLTWTVPQKCKHKNYGFWIGSCDTAAEDGRCDSNVYEVNQGLWQFGLSKQHLGGLSAGRKEAALQETCYVIKNCQWMQLPIIFNNEFNNNNWWIVVMDAAINYLEQLQSWTVYAD